MAGSSWREAGSGASGQTRTSGAVSAVPTIVVLLALGFALRLIIAYVLLPNSGFPSDLTSFRAWGQAIATSGPMGFYDGNGFHDYPPVYLYMLGVIGVLTSPQGGIGEAVKLVPMLCDLALAVIVWKMAEELGAARWKALLAAFVVIVNPVTWLNSAIWGQADSVGTVFLLLGLRDLIRDRRERASAWAVVAALTKPQLGILAILVGIVVIRRSLWRAEGQPLEPRRIVTSILAGAFTAAAICLPFVGFHFDTILTELSGPVGWAEAVFAVLVGIGVFYAVLTTKSEWLRGPEAEQGDAAPMRDPVGILTAVGFAISATVLFLGIRFDVIVGQMVQTFGEYALLTVNAYNPWALVSAQNGQHLAGMATTTEWVSDFPDLDPAHSLGRPIFMVGPFATNVAVPVAIAALGFVVAAIMRMLGRPSARIALVGLAVAAAAGLVTSIPGTPIPATVQIAPSLVGETALLATLAGTSIWAARRDDDLGLIVALSILAIAFFVVPTRAHERYLFPFFAIGALLLAISGRWARLYLVLAAANLVNLVSVLTQYGGLSPDNVKPDAPGFGLAGLLNDWGTWVRTWHLNSSDPYSLIIPIAAVALIMGFGFLWSIAQLTPWASAALEAEREAAGLDYLPGAGHEPGDEDEPGDEGVAGNEGGVPVPVATAEPQTELGVGSRTHG